MPKVRRDAKLMSLPLDRQAEVIALATDTGITRKTLERLRAELGISVGSTQTLSKFWHWYHSPTQRIERDIEASGSITRTVVERLRAQQLPISEEELFQFGQRFFCERAIAKADQKEWVTTQAAHREKERSVLARQEFQRDTCELFLRWFEDKQAREIAAGSGTHAEKIEQIGQLIFGEGWK